MKNLLRQFATVAMLLSVVFGAYADRKVDMSQLPAAAQAFLGKHYASVSVRECEIDGNQYDVELRNGVDMEFTSDGKLIKIDAGRKKVPVAVLKEILPAGAVKELESRKALDNVEEVELRNAGIKIELHQLFNDELRFDRDGNLLSVED